MESRPTSCATWPRPLPLLCRPMSLAVRTRCSSAQPAPACTQWGHCRPSPCPPSPLVFCLLTCRAHSIPCAQADAQFKAEDGSLGAERDGQLQGVPPLLALRDRGREDRHALPLAAPPLLRSVTPPSSAPAPAGATVLAPRAGNTYLLLYHSSPLLLHRLQRPPPACCTPPPVTPARCSVAPLFLSLMPPPERPPTPTRRVPTPPACCTTTAPRSSCTSWSDHLPLTRRRCAT